MNLTETVDEVQRVMSICNACRYCEGHCSVFKAMESRLEFNLTDANYLSNLCHNCSACYHHCQYAAPHEFDLHVPRTMSQMRQHSYINHAWPNFVGQLFAHNAWLSSIILLLCLVLFLFGLIQWQVPHDQIITELNFYNYMPHNVMAGLFGVAGLFALLGIFMSCYKYWCAVGLPGMTQISLQNWREALAYALTLKNLDGGNGQGCTYPTEAPSLLRRWFHHFTMYGFLACFAATSLGTIYHYGLSLPAPYDYFSLPKFFGIIGGIGLIVGCTGLLWLKLRADQQASEGVNKNMDVSFILYLWIISVTGFALMLTSGTRWLGLSLAVHLATVLALFVTMPYGKFIHGFFRIIALLAFVRENGQ